MGKGKRNRQLHTHEEIEAKRKADELAARIERLSEKLSQLTFKEKLKWNWYYYMGRLKVQHIARKVYDFFLTIEPKKFKRDVYKTYADGKVFGDYGDFHNLMTTKCPIFDNNWMDYINNKGNIIRKVD